MIRVAFKKSGLLLAGLSLAIFFVFSSTAQSATIEKMSAMPVINDYVVGPGKVELLVSPGQTIVKNITVTNRFGKEKIFRLELEDIKGSRSDGVILEFLGPLNGPYSLKDYLKPDTIEFVLQHGDRITIPVYISIPKDAVPGGLYGSVIVTTKDDPNDPEYDPNDANANVKVTSRIAVLFFIRIKGEVKESGKLLDFKADHFYYGDPLVNFSFSYENSGSVYSNPYGNISIKNFYGATVDSLDVAPFYILPDSVRAHQIKWDGGGFRMGYYTAILKLNYGFDNQLAEKAISFLIMPWKIIIGVLAALALFVLVMRFIIKWLKENVEIKRKK